MSLLRLTPPLYRHDAASGAAVADESAEGTPRPKSSVTRPRANVLILASGLGIGGAEIVMKHLALNIDRRRFNVMVCCIKVLGVIGQELEQSGVDIVALSKSVKPHVDYFAFLKLLRLIRQRQIDVVHTHTTDGLVDATLCKLLRPRLKVVHTFHFGNYPHVPTRNLWMERICSRLVDRLFAVGEVQRRQLQRSHGLRDRSIGTVLNGVLPAHIQDGRSFRASVGAENKLLIGTTASLIEQKGLPDLLAVAARFRHRPDVRFVIVGGGRLRGELEAMRRKLALEETVALPGWLPNAAETALPAFDVFFQPSLWEAMSIAVLEAMAASKPIVATRVGENAAIIDDGVNGLLVKPKDIDGMAAAIARLVDDESLRRRLGEAAARKVAQHFTVAEMTRHYEDIYLDVTDGADRFPPPPA